MRFLILSAFLACASAAPSGVLAPVAIAPAIPVARPLVPLAYSALAPTISPGDIQAAVIDAQVKAHDIAIAAIDKARELSELAVKNVNEKVEVDSDQIKEKVEEKFWSSEDKKWQAIDALKTAEAQIDGSIANNADALAKSAITPYIAVAPAVGLQSVYYNPGIVAPVLRSAELKEVKVKSADVKAAEASDSITVEAVKPGEKVLVKNTDEKTVIASAVAPLPLVEPLKYPIVTPGVIPPLLKYGAVPYGNVPYLQTIGLGPQTVLAPQIRLAPQIGLASQIGLESQIGLTSQIGLASQIGLDPTVFKTW